MTKGVRYNLKDGGIIKSRMNSDRDLQSLESPVDEGLSLYFSEDTATLNEINESEWYSYRGRALK